MNLKEIRTEKGITLVQLHEMTGIPKRTIEQTIYRDTCSVKTAISLADALGVTLDELCRDKTD